MEHQIMIRRSIPAPQNIRFRCHPGLAERFPELNEYARHVGRTTVLELQFGTLTVFAKLEWENPGGTVKDRAVLGMLHALLERKHKPLHVLEYTGGSLGLTLAKVCRRLELPLTLVLSEATPKSVISELQALGCEFILIPRDLGFWGVMEKALEIHVEQPEKSFLFQHENEANFKMHREFTGPEFLVQLNGHAIGAWVAAVGTGGTYAGVLQTLRSVYPNIEGYAVTPAEMPFGTEAGPNGLSKFVGAGGLGYGKKQKFVLREDPRAKHLHFRYEECRQIMLEMYLQTGIEIGSSAAANLLGCLKAHAQAGHNQIATVFPSRPSREESQWLHATKKEVSHGYHSERRPVMGGRCGLDSKSHLRF